MVSETMRNIDLAKFRDVRWSGAHFPVLAGEM
jgi:hypothetical protein